jgi:hypothetical protein
MQIWNSERRDLNNDEEKRALELLNKVILSLGCSVISVAFYFSVVIFLYLCLIGWSTFHIG